MDGQSSEYKLRQDRLRTRWTASLDKIFADLVVEQVQLGNKRTNNVFDKKTWKHIRDEFNRQTGLNFDKKQLRKHLVVLRTRYYNLKSVFDQDGFGLDGSQCMITNEFELGEQFIEVQPKPEAIRIKDCPIYEQLCTIFSEKGADGRYAQSSHYGESHKETTGMETPATASCPKSANTPFNPSRPSMFAQHDSSSPSRPDTLDGRKKRRSETQSGQGLRMRNCDGTTGDAIAEAMLEMAAASKLRAVAMTQANDQFSISGCIKALDEMQGVDQNIYFAALDLFENPNLRETFVSLKNEKRLAWLQGKCMALSGSMV